MSRLGLRLDLYLRDYSHFPDVFKVEGFCLYSLKGNDKCLICALLIIEMSILTSLRLNESPVGLAQP